MLQLHSYSLVSNDEFQTFYNNAKGFLPSNLISKTERFKFLEDRQRSLIGELMVRKFYREKLGIEELKFGLNEQEKPFLLDFPNEHFNISHSGDFVVVAFSHENLGVDVEMIGKDRRSVAERFFTVREIEQMRICQALDDQIHFFYKLWTLKESYMKAIGRGMTMSLSSFSFIFNDDVAVLDFTDNDPDWNFHSQLWKDKAYLSICSKVNEEYELTEMKLDDLK